MSSDDEFLRQGQINRRANPLAKNAQNSAKCVNETSKNASVPQAAEHAPDSPAISGLRSPESETGGSLPLFDLDVCRLAALMNSPSALRLLHMSTPYISERDESKDPSASETSDIRNEAGSEEDEEKENLHDNEQEFRTSDCESEEANVASNGDVDGETESFSSDSGDENYDASLADGSENESFSTAELDLWRRRLLIAFSKDSGDACAALVAYEAPVNIDGNVVAYIDRVDTTGAANGRGVARALIQAYIKLLSQISHSYGADSVPVKTISVHVYAKSCSEYLFFGSQQNEAKRQHCGHGFLRWWINTLENSCDAKSIASRTMYSPGFPNSPPRGACLAVGWDYRLPWEPETLIGNSAREDGIPRIPTSEFTRLLHRTAGDCSILSLEDLKAMWDTSAPRYTAYFTLTVECLQRRQSKSGLEHCCLLDFYFILNLLQQCSFSPKNLQQSSLRLIEEAEKRGVQLEEVLPHTTAKKNLAESSESNYTTDSSPTPPPHLKPEVAVLDITNLLKPRKISQIPQSATENKQGALAETSVTTRALQQKKPRFI